MNRLKGGMQRLIGILAGLGMGVALGILLVRIIDLDAVSQMGVGEFALTYGMLLLMVGIALALQFMIHEAGHLVCGLISGYRFSSYRVGSLMVLRKDGRLCLKRLSMPGTGGQCLMVPPGTVDGTFPVVLYNLGGIIANLVAAALCGCLLPLAHGHRFASVFLGSMVFIGVMIIVTNGIPLRGAAVPNDGWNALNLGKDSLARRSFWVQLSVNGKLTDGVRLKDMPNEWFELPPDERLGETFAATLTVLAENRLMDQHRFREADALAAKLLADGAGTVGLHRPLVVCDHIFCKLMLGQDPHEEVLEEGGISMILKQLADFPSVLRTRYALELLAHGNPDAALPFRERFEQVARSYPTEADINAERELMALADARAAEQTSREGL